jgi:hypothetical protein
VTQSPRAGADGRPGEPGELDPGGCQDETDELLGLVFACCHPRCRGSRRSRSRCGSCAV